MGEPINPRLRRAVFEVVQNQLSANDPPETRQTLDRLIAEGHSKDEAMELIACVAIDELFGVLRQGRAYDNDRYVTALHALPNLPQDEDD